jgi:ABC-type lipoprotein release transport system permease subunit
LTDDTDEEKTYYQQIVAVAGVLAGLLFAGLILVFSNLSTFLNPIIIPFPIIPAGEIDIPPRMSFVGIIFLLALGSSLFAFASLMAADLASRKGLYITK